MEKSYKHHSEKDKINLLHKFNMQCPEKYPRTTFEEIKDSMEPYVPVSVDEHIAHVLKHRDGAASLRGLFERLAPRFIKARNLQYLLTYPSLEMHRKVLLLQHFHGSGLPKFEPAANPYVIVDPVTLFVPLLIG